jgi:hypothetical protein
VCDFLKQKAAEEARRDAFSAALNFIQRLFSFA